jgi:hypothetical protein
MKTQMYETCPNHSNNFITGVGFSFFDPNGKKEREIEVRTWSNQTKSTLVVAALTLRRTALEQSLNIVLDSVKIVTGGDFKFNDGSGWILAFNAFHECSHKWWYDFEVQPGSSSGTSCSLRAIASSGSSCKIQAISEVVTTLFLYQQPKARVISPSAVTVNEKTLSH